MSPSQRHGWEIAGLAAIIILLFLTLGGGKAVANMLPMELRRFLPRTPDLESEGFDTTPIPATGGYAAGPDGGVTGSCGCASMSSELARVTKFFGSMIGQANALARYFPQPNADGSYSYE